MSKPTPTELTILKLLWRKEPRSAREIHDEIEPHFNWSYSSTRKTLERMCDKGFLSEDMQANKKIYSALLAKVPTLALFAQDFARQVLELDGPLPVAMFGDSKLIEAQELEELESVLGELENQRNKQS